MEEIKPKDNKAHLLLVCEAPKRKDCVYYIENEVGDCEYICGQYCTSAIAKVNKCVLYLKEQGIMNLKEQGVQKLDTDLLSEYTYHAKTLTSDEFEEYWNEVQGKKGKKKMAKYEYNNQKNKFLENGHTMFEEDVLQRLKRLEYLEEKFKQDKKKKGCHNCGLEKSRTT